MKESLFASLDLHCLQMELEWCAQNHCSDTVVRTQYQRLSQRVSVLQKMDDTDFLFLSPSFLYILFYSFLFTSSSPSNFVLVSFWRPRGNGQRDPHICRDNVVLWSTEHVFSKCLVDYANSSSFVDTDLGVPNIPVLRPGLELVMSLPWTVYMQKEPNLRFQEGILAHTSVLMVELSLDSLLWSLGDVHCSVLHGKSNLKAIFTVICLYICIYLK